MAIVFAMTFSLLGAWLSDVMALGVDAVIGWIDKGLIVAQINPVVRSLVVDGICQGVGSVISFLPTIVILFSSCRFWRIRAIWRGLHLSWINRFVRSDYRAEASCRC